MATVKAMIEISFTDASEEEHVLLLEADEALELAQQITTALGEDE